MHSARTFLSLGVSTLAVIAGCGGVGFDSITPGDTDSGAADAGGGANDAGVADSSAIDATSSDASIDTGPGVCAAPGAGATDVYVDSRFTGSPALGAAACPFPTILQGITAAAALTGIRTVHVAGATPALVYDETSSITVGPNIILRGDGPLKTTLNAAGVCGAGTCAVFIEGGGTLEGFTVTSAGSGGSGGGGDGIVANHNSPPPVVKNVAARGSKDNGIVALGAIELGPNITASNNGANGVRSPPSATGVINIRAGSNAFDNNEANGVIIEGAAKLNFEGGSASDNTFSGVLLYGVPAATINLPTHTITGLNASRNGTTGISVFGPQNVTLRTSTLLANTNLGLRYDYGAASVLDIGPAGGTGGNVFGGATLANRNGKAGIYLCRSRGQASQEGAGDSFAACAPTQTSTPGCDTMPSSYTDVAYFAASASTSGNPLVATGCAVGP